MGREQRWGNGRFDRFGQKGETESVECAGGGMERCMTSVMFYHLG